MSDQPIHFEALGVDTPVDDLELIRNGLWDREGAHGTDHAALSHSENWDYAEIHDAWITHVQEQLAQHGIRFTPDSGMVTLADDVDHGTARQAWHGLTRGLDAWLDQVAHETREGRPDAHSRDVRPDTAPGGRWVTEAETDRG